MAEQGESPVQLTSDSSVPPKKEGVTVMQSPNQVQKTKKKRKNMPICFTPEPCDIKILDELPSKTKEVPRSSNRSERIRYTLRRIAKELGISFECKVRKKDLKKPKKRHYKKKSSEPKAAKSPEPVTEEAKGAVQPQTPAVNKPEVSLQPKSVDNGTEVSLPSNQPPVQGTQQSAPALQEETQGSPREDLSEISKTIQTMGDNVGDIVSSEERKDV